MDRITMPVAHRHSAADNCLMSVGVVHMLNDRSMACTRCSWVHVQSRFFEGGIAAATEHDATHQGNGHERLR